MKNKVKVLAEVAVDDNALIIDYIKTFQKRYGQKKTKAEVLEMLIESGIDKMKSITDSMKIEIRNYEQSNN